MWLIVGLGNPGPEYKETRHNIGFLVVDELAFRGGMRLKKRKMKALYASGTLGEKEVILLKPQNFMNRSGLCVSPWLGALQLGPAQMIVIHDDLDLFPFRIRIAKGGSHAGHRGVLSIAHSLDSRDFIRIRVGVGKPPAGTSGSDYVLQVFPAAEKQLLFQGIRSAADAALAVMEKGLAAAMNTFNVRDRSRNKGGVAFETEGEKSKKMEVLQGGETG